MRMLVVVALLVAYSVSGANVRWNTAVLSDWGNGEYDLNCVITTMQNVDVSFRVLQTGNEFSIESLGSNLAFSGNIKQMNAGDVVSELSIRNQHSYFYHIFVDEFNRDQNYVKQDVVTDGHPFYLAFVSTSVDYISLTYPNPVYGWVQLQVSPDGTVSLLKSAFDLDGGAIIVDGGAAIPEPSSVVLMILGIALVGILRSHRKSSKIAEVF